MKNLLYLAVLFCTSFIFAQNVTFTGIVKDTLGAPLEMANVMAVNQATKGVDAYSITNDKGKFQLNLKQNSDYNIRFTFLGLKTKTISVKTASQDINDVITMSSDATMLDGIEIVREMPVSIKGDTIIYNSDSFTNGTERKLEDVLKKLPGVEVNADGEIEVEGKKVQKLMVEGKDFFDGDTKLGVKNIPADAIDKIQVLRNFNEVGALKGLENNEESVAMNIKLKSGKKNFWFGDISAAAGRGIDDFRYVVNPKIFYYSPKYSINLISNFNDIGELPLTAQDYFKFSGGFRNMMRKGGTSFTVSSNDLGIALIRNNRAKEIITKFGAANFSFNPSKAWSFSGFGILSNSITDLQTNSRTQRVDRLPNGQQVTTIENTTNNSQQQSNLGFLKLSTAFNPKETLQVEYDALIKKSTQNEVSQLNSDVVSNVLSQKRQNPFSINQTFNFYNTLNDKNVLAIQTQHLYQNEDPFYNANLANQPFSFIGYLPQSRSNLTQNRFVKTNKFDTKADYYYAVTPKAKLNFTLGNTYSYQNFNTAIFQTLDSSIKNPLTDISNSNQVKYSFNDAFVGLHYRFIYKKFTFNPGFTVHNFSLKNQQLNGNFSQNFNRFLPDFNVLYQLKKSESLSYNFALTNEFTDIVQLSEGAVFSNYNSIFRGNKFLENATSQTHSLRYFKYNLFNMENIVGNINYSKKVDVIQQKVFFDGVNQTSTSINIPSNFANESISGRAEYGRTFLKYYKARFTTNLSWNKFNNVQTFNNNTITPTDDVDNFQVNELFNQNYTFSFSTTFNKWPTIELGYNININDSNIQKFYTERPFVKLEYYFLEAFSFTADYEYNHFYNQSRTSNNEYDFLNVNLMYRKKDSKWEYKLSATNLLNTTTQNDDSFNQFFTRTSQFFVQPRFVMLGIRYNL